MIKLLIIFLMASPIASAFWPVPWPGDLTGNGRHDLVLYDKSQQLWTILSYDGQTAAWQIPFGEVDSIPLVGRFHTTNQASIAYYHIPTGRVVVRPPLGTESDDIFLRLESNGTPVIGDFNDDGFDDIALVFEAEGIWKIWSHTGEVLWVMPFHPEPGMRYLAGDMDGAGSAVPIAYHPSAGSWHIFDPTGARDARTVTWRHRDGEPFVRDFNDDGRADLALCSRDGVWQIMDAVSDKMIVQNVEFGDRYAVPVPGTYEGGTKNNLSYYTMGHGQWYVQTHDGITQVPNRPRAIGTY